MHIRMKVTLTGTRDGVDWPPRGACTDLPDDEAAHLCAGGMAEPCVDHAPPIETATAPAAPRTATRRRK